MQFNLTATQRSALEQTLGAHAPGHHVIVHELHGAIDIARWQRAVRTLLQSSSIFRRSYLPGDDGWLIVEAATTKNELAVFDVMHAPSGTSLALVDELISRVFRPEEAPLIRVALVVETDRAFLVLTAASFVIDLFSMRPLFQALSRAYAGELVGDLTLNQTQLLATETEYLASAKHDSSLQFWRPLLTGIRYQWQPAKWNDLSSPTFWSASINETETAALYAFSARIGVPLESVLVLAFHMFLRKLTTDETIVTALAHRIGAEDANGLGFCEQRPVILSRIDANTTVRDFLAHGHRLIEYAKFHAGLHRGEMLSIFRKKDPSLVRMTNVTFETDLLPYDALRVEGLTITLLPALSQRVDLSDITITMTHGSTLRFNVSVRNPAHAAAVAAAATTFHDLLRNLPDALDGTIAALSMLCEATRAQAIAHSDGGPLTTAPRAVLERFNDMVAQHPDASALRCGDEHYTYAELSIAADKVAAALLPLVTDSHEPLVGICMTRGARMIVALIGVLRSGAGYLPLDPANPVDRLSFILSDAGARAVLVDEKTTEIAAKAAAATTCVPTVVVIDDALAQPHLTQLDLPVQRADSIAYVIYTSGTTGKPKGVVVERRHAAVFVAASEQVAGCTVGNRWLQFASLNFDASVLEIFNCLTRGAELNIAPSEVRADPKALWSLLRDARITHAFIPPAMLRVLPRQPLPDLANIYCGGEASDDATVLYWSNATQLWNVYGPTETTVLCSANLLEAGRGASNLGRPLPGYTMYVLDALGEPTPLCGIGEIFIGGDAVTRGYFGRPELTEQRFIANPFGSGRLYRSGDLARRLPNGELEYLGRNDFQVKVRGFRIQIGDIEAAIRAVNGVRGVFVTVVEGPGGQTLAAWYVSTATLADTVRNAISAVLPQYMVPTHLLRLDAFPVNISGKIDRTRLLLPSASDTSVKELLTPLQRQVRAAWAQTLKCNADGLGTASHFFHLGGHSLAASVVCSTLTSQLGVGIRPRTLFEYPVLAAFCEQLAHADASSVLPPIERSAVKSAPVVGALIPMMVNRAAQHGSDNTYTIVVRIDMDPRVNPQVLRRALREVLASDPIFRTAIVEEHARVHLVEQETTASQIPLIDCPDEDIDARIEAMRNDVFELKRAPLWRAAILVGESGRTVLGFSVNHGIFDGWSLNLFLELLGRSYDAVLNSTPLGRDAATVFDYGIWSDAPARKGAWTSSVSYWERKLHGVSARTELPATSTTRRPDANAWLPLRLEPAVVAGLKRLASDLDVTLPPVLFAAYLVWLWRLTGQRALTVAYPYAGRDVPGSEQILGMFVTMGFLHETLDINASFSTLIKRIAAQMVNDREHLVASPYDIDLSSIGVPNILFSLQTGINLATTIGGFPCAAHELPSRTSKADIGGIFYETIDQAIEGRIEFDSSLLDPALVKGFLRSFESLVTSASASATASLVDVPYLSDAERALITSMATGPALPTCASTIVERFASIVKEHPQRIALECAEKSWTYTELDAVTDRLASALLTRHHPAAQTPIGLSVTKSGELIQGALAILKAGCAYVPLDPHYPADRLRYLIEDSGARLIIADASSAEIIRATGASDVTFVDPFDASLAQEPVVAFPRVRGSDLAYVIYTSGSTGKPKGVLIEHQTLPRMIAGAVEPLSFTPDSRFMLLGTLNFDASVLQVFMPLLNGGTLVVPAPNIEKEPEVLHQALRDARVTHVCATPSLIRNFPHTPLPDMQVLGFGGEAIDAATAAYWSQHTRFFSMYGPTETTVMSSTGLIAPGANSRIIGRPLAGYTMQLLDAQMQQVPFGAIGEIYIGGGCDARGYLGKPELTMERFVVDPCGDSPYARSYRSGDLGRFLSDGTIEYFGRNDDQIKLRGFRIELGEIESALQRVAGISAGAAAVRGEGDLRAIVGYYTTATKEALDEKAIRSALAVFLPEYMMPSFLVHLQEFPLNANAKLDRKALPAVSMHAHAGDPPREGIETLIAQVWEDLLRFKGVGRDDDFFHLGGNSLLAARLQSQLRERCGLELSISTLYAKPTIAGLADASISGSINAAVSCARAGLRVREPIAEGVAPEVVRHALLTGAGGFLGIYLLQSLLGKVETVSCLMRGRDETTVQAMLHAAADRAGLLSDWSRVRIVLGDLGAPNLALTAGALDVLAHSIDAIIHCGAWVHHRYSYETLKATNVDATADLLRLAMRGKRKRFCFVSTESASEAIAGIERVAEAVLDIDAHPPVSEVGYLLTKWTAEQLVADASRRYGLDAVIARPGNITGDSRTGYSNYDHNHFWLFTKGCVQLGAYPEISSRVEMTPVDRVADKVVGLCLMATSGLRVSNLSNPVSTTWPAFLSEVAAAGGFRVERFAVKDWQARLATIDESNALWQIRAFYEGDLSGTQLPVDHDATVRCLTAAGVAVSPAISELTPRYVSYLKTEGFLPSV
ncbi:MAG: amino acid adenylation domain-containing protein [Planctomycetota bacterium]|nr:MAG: amino acid adenylation domain-containing protein [Planctomycetota bacterium]